MRNLVVFQQEGSGKSYATNTTVKHRDFFWLDFLSNLPNSSRFFFEYSQKNLSKSKQFKLLRKKGIASRLRDVSQPAKFRKSLLIK